MSAADEYSAPGNAPTNKPVVPDFRSSGGLFNSLKSQHNLKGSGKQLFDAAVYRDSDSTSSFHDMVRSLSSITKTARPTRFHHLLASLAQEGRLLRLYSQNVDGIDTSLPPLHTQVPLPRKAPWPKTIQLHGGLSKMVCTKCSALNDFEAELFDGPIPPACQQCEQLDYTRTEVAGKRSHGVGKLRPRMVLYNEGNPDDEAIGSCAKADLRRRPDCIIVVGTTLKVPGVKRIVREMCGIVRDHRDGLSVWINSDPEPAAKEFENSWDIIVKGTSDDVAEHAALRQWDDENIDEIKVMSEAEVDEIRNKAGLKVVVDSPTKQRVLSPGSLPTPVDSPRPSLQRTYSDASISQVKVKKLTLTMNNPASKGRRLDDLLPALPQRAALKGGPSKRATTGSKSKGDETSKPRGRPPKAAAPVKAPPKKRGPKKVEPTRNGQIDFQISKVNPLVKPNKKDMAQVKRPEPLTASPSRENLPSPPRPSEAKAGEGKIIAA